MVSRKIIWSHKAKIKLYQILEYYITRNQSKSYSQKLYKKIHSKISLLKKQAFIGIKTDE